MPGDIRALAACCEAAAGSNIELDMLIDAALSGYVAIEDQEPPKGQTRARVEGKDESGGWHLLGWADWCSDQRNFEPYGSYPAYTASLDAALTLVPESWGWAVTNLRGGDNGEFDRSACTAVIQRDKGTGLAGQGDAPSAALALCAAALRAKAGQ